jgi:hypothetical protein
MIMALAAGLFWLPLLLFNGTGLLAFIVLGYPFE